MNHTQLAKPTPEYLAELQKLQASLRTIVTTLRTLSTTPFALDTTNAHITAAIDTLNDHLLHLHIIERGLQAMGVTLTEPKIFNHKGSEASDRGTDMGLQQSSLHRAKDLLVQSIQMFDDLVDKLRNAER